MVLIGIALFAALSYAITRNSKGSNYILNDGEARTVAEGIIQYGDSLRPIIDKMMLLNGISDTDSPAGSGILFDLPGAGTAPLTRELFDPTGGNAPYMVPPLQACLSTCAYVFSGQYTLTGVGSGSNPDLVMLLVNIPQNTCKAINVILGNGTTIPTGAALTTTTAFNGTNYGTNPVSLTTSYHSLCYQESTGAVRYIYVNVIRAR